jgi:hypothetical protein
VVGLLYPAADSSVADEFSIFFTAIDPRLVHHVDILLNGSKYATLDGYDFPKRADPYNFQAPSLPDGYIDVEVKAYNDINSDAGTATATVLKGEPCTSSDQCFPFMECTEGRCKYPPPPGELGDECPYDQYCLDRPCAHVGSERRCSQSCTPNVSDACPDGYDCLDNGLCWPQGGGGCRAVGVAGGRPRDGSFPLALLTAFAGGLLLLRRRSKRL